MAHSNYNFFDVALLRIIMAWFCGKEETFKDKRFAVTSFR